MPYLWSPASIQDVSWKRFILQHGAVVVEDELHPAVRSGVRSGQLSITASCSPWTELRPPSWSSRVQLPINAVHGGRPVRCRIKGGGLGVQRGVEPPGPSCSDMPLYILYVPHSILGYLICPGYTASGTSSIFHLLSMCCRSWPGHLRGAGCARRGFGRIPRRFPELPSAVIHTNYLLAFFARPFSRPFPGLSPRLVSLFLSIHAA